MLMMDPDVIAPKNIIKELLKDNKDIISGLYYNYFKIWNCTDVRKLDVIDNDAPI